MLFFSICVGIIWCISGVAGIIGFKWDEIANRVCSLGGGSGTRAMHVHSGADGSQWFVLARFLGSKFSTEVMPQARNTTEEHPSIVNDTMPPIGVTDRKKFPT